MQETPIIPLVQDGEGSEEVQQLFARIRAAIEDDPKKPRRILTLRGTGYVFAKDQDR